MVIPVLENDDSCYEASADDKRVRNEQTDDCNVVLVQSINFTLVTAIKFSFDTSFESFTMDFSTAHAQDKCNTGDEDVSQIDVQTNSIARQCYGYGQIGSVVIENPPLALESVGNTCTDSFFIYHAYSTGSPTLPDDITLSVN